MLNRTRILFDLDPNPEQILMTSFGYPNCFNIFFYIFSTRFCTGRTIMHNIYTQLTFYVKINHPSRFGSGSVSQAKGQKVGRIWQNDTVGKERWIGHAAYQNKKINISNS